MAASRGAETPEQTSTRLGDQRRRQATSRAAETPEQTSTRLGDKRTRQAAFRAAETPEQTSTRLGDQCTRQAASRAAETAEQRQARREEDRTRRSTSRAARWTFMEREAFQYDPTKSYDSRPQLYIGRMTEICSYCDALKWPGEAPGMCCSNGKVKLPPLRLPPEPLESLMSGTTATSKHFLENIRNMWSIQSGTIWGSYKESLTEDILIQARRKNPGLVLNYIPDMFNQTLIILEDKALGMDGKDLKQLGLPSPQRTLGDRLTREIFRETSYDLNDLNKYISANEPLLLPDQRAAYNAILDRINRKAGGTGKTFVINLLLAKIRQESKIAIAVASSGIAATLLHGGRIAHSTLKLPLNLTQCEAPLCNISKGTGEAKVVQECKLIVWDECTMAHRQALEALDRTLQDLRGNGKLVGGAVLLLAGDFRQTLPVIPKGTMADELKACLKASYLWRHVHKLELKTNMRVHLQSDVAAGQFAQQLLSLGDGKIAADPTTGLITIPNNFCNIVDSIETLKTSVFPDIRRCFNNHKWLCERAILAPKNGSVNAINLQIQQQLPGVDVSYKSIDTVVDIDQAVQYPTEFLNSLEPPGMPPHSLVLKVGSPIMLLRILDAPRLCNGTRLCVKSLMPHVIEATILTGCAKGEDVFMPRIPMVPNDMPLEFKSLQFPVRLAFAMSINKAQGQSLKVAGINLGTPCFSHGQLYVACSRVGTGKNLYVFAPDGKTRNIVYQTALK
ncbi:unnamed protein product [Rotaria sp. Silwood1]|nr:unnamed protein product [Rotaria sp. Silwood1]CAF1625527.1 unnamed protein product [Rotaria sp. Silwood1]